MSVAHTLQDLKHKAQPSVDLRHHLLHRRSGNRWETSGMPEKKMDKFWKIGV
jgi:hypothetical protein